jgi:hypothetical protein
LAIALASFDIRTRLARLDKPISVKARIILAKHIGEVASDALSDANQLVQLVIAQLVCDRARPWITLAKAS